MSYKKAINILPDSLLKEIHEYVDGEFIYIPRKFENKRAWGHRTSIRKEIKIRNTLIYKDYQSGYSSKYLSQKYYLSLKSIQRIIREQKRW